MTITEKTIIEALPASPGTAFDFKGVYVDAEGASHNVTVFDTEYFTTNVIQLYRNRRLVVDEDQEGYLANLFRIWKSSRENLYLKQAWAYTLKYNPIENYSSVEQMVDDTTEHEKGASFKDDYHNTDTETLTPFQKETTETTPYETKTETIPYETKTETTPYEVKTETTPYNTKVETTPYETTVETTPYTSETTTTTPHGDATTTSVKGFNSSNWSESEKTERSGYVEEELIKDGTEKVETTHNNTKETVETTHNNTKETVETTYNDTIETVEVTHNNTKETVETTHNNTKEKVEKTYQGTQEIETAHTGYIEHTTDGTDTDTRNYTLYKNGNIGVMTPSEMLQKEYDGLMQDLAHRALYEFINRYTWYSEEVD